MDGFSRGLRTLVGFSWGLRSFRSFHSFCFLPFLLLPFLPLPPSFPSLPHRAIASGPRRDMHEWPLTEGSGDMYRSRHCRERYMSPGHKGTESRLRRFALRGWARTTAQGRTMQNGVPLFGTSNGNHCRNTGKELGGPFANTGTRANGGFRTTRIPEGKMAEP